MRNRNRLFYFYLSSNLLSLYLYKLWYEETTLSVYHICCHDCSIDPAIRLVRKELPDAGR